MLKNLLNILYPNVCGMCGKISKDAICKKCELKFNNVLNPTIVESSKKYYFNNHIYIFKYEGIIRKLLIEYKFNERSYLYRTFSKIIIKNEKICGILKNYDIIIPVPISKKRKLKRGYNQSEIIVKELVKHIPNLKLEVNLLLKKIDNKQQSSLTKQQRKENVKNVYILSDIEKIRGRNVIIFDDIYTTGSTVNECSKLLKKAGANKITVLTIAKD